MSKAIVIFDTNVLLSAIGWKGRPFDCVELARSSEIEGITCREILDELAEKLETKLLFSPDLITEPLLIYFPSCGLFPSLTICE